MRRIVLLLIVFLLSFGCLEQKTYQGAQSEQIAGSSAVSLDNISGPDYVVYNFAPVTYGDSGMVVERQVSVSVATSSYYNSVYPNLTDVDLLGADQNLDQFSKSEQDAESSCSQAIGLSNVVCSDIVTCSRLCASASQKCRTLTANNDEVIAGSMISLVQDNNQIHSLILDARKSVLSLRNTTEESRNGYLNDTRQIVAKIASINANPLYSYTGFGLCSNTDYGISYLLAAANTIGPYTTQNVTYHYRVLLSVKPTQNANAGGVQVAGVSLTDRIPRTAVSTPDQIQSIQTIASSEDPLNVVVNWNSPKAQTAGYLMYYEFDSDQAPETVIPSLVSPDLKVQRINLIFLGPTDFMLTTIYSLSNNYFVAYGAALGFTLAILLLIYNILVLAFTMISERAAGATFTTGFRKAFGRTDVRWKGDAVVAIVFLILGFYVSSALATQPATPPPLIESLDFLLTSQMGLVGIGLVFLGVVMGYFALENFAKITILERAYGMVIRQEKDTFLNKAATLKDKMKELEELIDEYSHEDFDVGKEYDILASVKSDKLDALSKEMTARSKAIIEDHLGKVETAIASLKERKKLADDNWAKWKANIAKLLDEQNEVYTSSLVTVPASLRSWALGKYVKESGVEGISFERDALKKKKITPEQLVQEMIDKELIRGAIVLKQDKVVISDFAEGNTTVMTALALKLNTYIRSLAKNLGQHPPSSYVAIGEKDVIVIMKNRAVDSVLFLSKSNFNEAVEQWKTKMKIFESG